MTLITNIILSLGLILGSPDGRLSVELNSTSASNICYTVAYDGNTVILPSKLGILTNNADYTSLSYIGHETELIDVNYSLDRIKTSKVGKEAMRTVVHFQTPDGRKIDIEWHISDNDIAFRYTLPFEKGTGSVRVLKEDTFFDFPAGTTTYLTAQSDPMAGWKRTKPSYEEYYRPGEPVGTRSEFGRGFTFPCLFKSAGSHWVLISETGVDSRYCGSRLSDYERGKGYCIAFPMPEENNGNGTAEPAFALPGSTAWRTITVGEDLAPIVETTIPFDVVEPKYETVHDYKFGKSTWSWILWQDGSINYDDQVAYIDLSAAMGYSYTLIDNFWDRNIGRDKMAELSAYARSKGVELFLWYSSSGWWNDITQSPVNIMCDHIARKKEMRWLQSIGVKGIKVDFFGGDKQETMALYEQILSDADDYGLMVIFHGCTIPRGWEKMYPNYVGSEAVRASENLVFNQSDCDREAADACMHPYVRNAVGCMEFGGTFLNKRLDRTGSRGSIRRTTDAFQLATAVIFQNPIQNFALAPNNLQDAPQEALEFLREVPTVWDETRYIAGEPGSSAVIARRNGSRWYVGAINADKQALKLDLQALGRQLGGNARVVLNTADGSLKKAEGSKKPLAIPQNDGAVIIVE